jgi:hypothetical protein
MPRGRAVMRRCARDLRGHNTTVHTRYPWTPFIAVAAITIREHTVHVVPTCDRGHTLYPVRAVWAAQNASQHRDVQSLLVVHARPVARFARRVYGAAPKDGHACQGTVHVMNGGCSIVQDRFHTKPSWQRVRLTSMASATSMRPLTRFALCGLTWTGVAGAQGDGQACRHSGCVDEPRDAIHEPALVPRACAVVARRARDRAVRIDRRAATCDYVGPIGHRACLDLPRMYSMLPRPTLRRLPPVQYGRRVTGLLVSARNRVLHHHAVREFSWDHNGRCRTCRNRRAAP